MLRDIIQLNETNSLKVPGITNLTQYHIAYDFRSNRLTHQVAGHSGHLPAYILHRGLANAVNSAIISGRPLLLKGEPGCGKTKLAKSVAFYFHGKDVDKYYFEWYIKSKSIARDGCYTFDHVNRLRDSTISRVDKKARQRIQHPEEYLRLGAIGKAFATEPNGNKPTVLLIDEIDKGDLDFPNDLLLELDEMRFPIEELEDTYISAPKGQPPLIFITSNNERELPPAFLRRCLYYHIPPFESKLLIEIAKNKLRDYYAELGISNSLLSDPDKLEQIVERFQEIRQNTVSQKLPSTSELLDWLKLLAYRIYKEPDSLENLLEDEGLQQLALKLM